MSAKDLQLWDLMQQKEKHFHKVKDTITITPHLLHTPASKQAIKGTVLCKIHFSPLFPTNKM